MEAPTEARRFARFAAAKAETSSADSADVPNEARRVTAAVLVVLVGLGPNAAKSPKPTPKPSSAMDEAEGGAPTLALVG